jgi:hypothetical protein
VNVRGIGNAMHYFDAVTPNHSSSILQTRQPNPPQRIKCVYVPFSLVDCKIGLPSGSGMVYLSIWSACPCRVIALDILDTARLQAVGTYNAGKVFAV